MIIEIQQLFHLAHQVTQTIMNNQISIKQQVVLHYSKSIVSQHKHNTHIHHHISLQLHTKTLVIFQVIETVKEIASAVANAKKTE